MKPAVHTAVMVDEVLEYLRPEPGHIILDCTLGAGGHSKKILEKITPGGRLIGIDQDREILKIAEKQLEDFKGSVFLKQANFRELDTVLDDLAIHDVDGLLFDLGVSSYQLESSQRGFSFNVDGQLDMRMGESGKTAYELVSFLSKEELADILFKFGQERYSRRIAETITTQRKHRPIRTTTQLRDIVLRAIPKSRDWQKIHPATRTFLALRIAVNDELVVLKEGLDKAIEVLRPTGRICVISFHSLEDRIVKNFFKDSQRNGTLEILTKRPVCPTDEEVRRNPRARSAKLRAAVKIN